MVSTTTDASFLTRFGKN